MSQYPYVDIAVLETIRRPFAAGDALVIVTRDLRQVLWANGSGLELFGLGRLDAALNGQAALDDIQRRQIIGSVPISQEERVVHLRFVQGPQTILLPVHVSVISMPDGIESLLLRIPVMALRSRTQTNDTLKAIRSEGSYAAFIKPGARLVSGAGDLAALDIDQEDLARMMREVAGENERLVKRQLRTAQGERPAALARLTDDDGLHLLIVVETDEAAVSAPELVSKTDPDLALETPLADVMADEIPVFVPLEEQGSNAFTDQISVADSSSASPTLNEIETDWPETVEELAVADSFSAAAWSETGVDDLSTGIDVEALQAPSIQPVRFAWKTDADSKFIDISEPFLEAVGFAQAELIGQTLRSLTGSIGIIDEANVADLFDKQGTWSGRTVLWPVAKTQTAIPVELAGLPVFARDRTFEGFRGFGIARLDQAVPLEEPDASAADSKLSDGNILPFGRRAVSAPFRPAITELDPQEREAFAEIGARLRVEPLSQPDIENEAAQVFKPVLPNTAVIALDVEQTAVAVDNLAVSTAPTDTADDNASIFSKLPLPVLVYSGEGLHFANSAFLELSGYRSLAAINEAGGLDALFGVNDETEDSSNLEDGAGMHLKQAGGSDVAVSAHLQSVPWGEGKALMLAVALRAGAPETEMATTELMQADVAPQMADAQRQIEELTAILDTATDGVVVLDVKGNIRSLNNAAQALFGYEEAEIAGQPLNALLAIESHRAAKDYIAGLLENGVASVLNDGRDMIGREKEGRFIPIFVNIARLSSSEGFCAVVKDVTNWKRAEEQLTTARRDAESASTNKTEFLAHMSHEIRTPLNAIIGFSDVMINERFGPIGNERYQEYLKDIHRSGNLVLSLVNDLLDISKIEAGAQNFDFRAIDLNAVVEEAVTIMQPQASRERVLIRTSFGYDLPQLVADARSITQIMLNLVSNAIRFTDAGGQVIVSTNYEQNGDLTLKVRDTGIGMNEGELEDALRPYRQVGQKQDQQTSGTGLGLPLARALAESNKAEFRIRSTPGEGTVIEIAFPASRVLAG